MKSHIAGFCLVVMVLLSVLTIPVQADYYSSTYFCVQINSSEGRINIRSGPGLEYPVIGEISNRTVVTIVDMEYNPNDGFMWGSAEWNGSYGGWISLRHTTVLTGSGYPSPDFYVITAGMEGAVNLRTSAGTSSRIIMEIPNGAELHVTGLIYNAADGFFWGAVYYNGYNGWISLRQTNLRRGYSTYSYYCYEPTPAYGAVLYSRNGELNLRSHPSHNSALVGTIGGGTPMYYYGENGFGYGSDGVTHEWFYVTTNYGMSGWVRGDLVW